MELLEEIMSGMNPYADNIPLDAIFVATHKK